MEISFGNKTLNIKFNIFRTPNYKKLNRELSDYFDKNDIEGIKIKNFELSEEPYSNTISPKEPSFGGCLTGGNYEKDLAKIGEKYGIKNLGFIYWCYGK